MDINNLPIYDTPYGKFVLEPMDGVCKHIAANKFWDFWILEHLDSLTKDSVCYDLGSHVGQITIYMAQRCKHVHSFEPQSINYERLVKNVELNELKNVTCYNVALYSKETKMAVDNIPDQKNVKYGWERYEACSLTLYENGQGDIQAKTLDSFNFDKVDFIKADIQNCEYDMLIGGLETIKKHRPAIIFEYSPPDGVHNHHLREYQEFFKNLNYNVKEIAGQNYLATPK